MFGRKGFHEATLKEVAELAEFSVGSVYSFFHQQGRPVPADLRPVGATSSCLACGPSSGPTAPRRSTSSTPLVDFQIGFFRQHPRFGRLFLRYSSATIQLGRPRRSTPPPAANYEESMALQAALFARGQAAEVFRPGDPEVLARLFSGLMSAYQALDPAVMSDGTGERYPLADLHDLVGRAFLA